MNPLTNIVPPLFPQASAVALAAKTQSGAASDSVNPPSPNQIDPNSFITLLTTQLQAQDPLDPLKPDQMVSELTSMNTLQQLIQIREGVDKLVGAASGTGDAGGAVAPAGADTARMARASLSSAIPAALSGSPLQSLLMKPVSQ